MSMSVVYFKGVSDGGISISLNSKQAFVIEYQGVAQAYANLLNIIYNCDFEPQQEAVESQGLVGYTGMFILRATKFNRPRSFRQRLKYLFTGKF